MHSALLIPSHARTAITPRQAPLRLEASACLPQGFALLKEAAGLQLVREGDGARLGVMVSFDFACDHAATLARMAAMRAAQAEAAA